MTSRSSLPRWPTLNLERRSDGRVCGIDEAGCAPLAGPVVAAAVVLPPGPKPTALRGLTDSKLLSAEKREDFFRRIQDIAQVGVGMASVEEIDTLNIHHADLLAMKRAFEALPASPDHALVDGRSKPALGCNVEAIVKGDRRSLSIAAASVVAKVTRDRMMRELAGRFPDYGWHTNVGYGTDAHYLGLLRKGPTEHHRRSFAPVNTIFSPMATAWQRFRFEPVQDAASADGLDLFFLRNDLYAVFDRRGRHIGLVKNLRGCWTFRAIGYHDGGKPETGTGPFSRYDGMRVEAPQAQMVIRLLSTG
ncbi:ribonuclease HII [Wenzhouxiangella limi]|uniref:Ribonuclease HII n=1 Tax=Wenzhouxiangella limi TaxID=2707351 RepID=A0A845V1E1_9GAMM|nr:ribonuclease HII [Wenzhouxiangella limi]